MEAREVLWTFLREFFNYEDYATGVERARAKTASDPAYRANWERIKTAIEARELDPGEPLRFVHESANQVLDENSDEEAYIWLAKMVDNIDRTDGRIDPY